ncbi:diguanylate cyclase [Permianibacter sp. IMCC34836]|uniref:diguanylate cyclase n=1 Tax=Permianibacter fluminis TaxID=2738515 RepID=UPI00155164C2|nr:diguanylate cyclase [Permianibacter fluminis]NQD36568.1 diguanylate cyclase [Permianibacter fluminis]
MKAPTPSPHLLLDQLRQEFCHGLPNRLTAIGEAFAAASAGDAVALETLQRALHSLVGAAGTFGYAELSQRARQLETAVRADRLPAAPGFLAEVKALSSWLAPTAATIAAPASKVVDLATASRPAHALSQVFYLVNTDTDTADLMPQLENFQLKVSICRQVDELHAGLMQTLSTPAAIVVDTGHLPPFDSPLFQTLDMASLRSHVLVIASKRRDFITRLQAAKLGAKAVLPQPLSLPDLLEVLDQPEWTEDSAPYRVLLVDDDMMVARVHSAILTAAGMQVQICTNAERLDIEVQDFAPELILLDVYMPNWDGPDVARALRMDSQYLAVPLVFLSSEENRTLQLGAMREGADDFLVKPISPLHLVESVRIRASRYRELRQVMMSDPLTHVMNRRALFVGIEREMSRSRRLQEPLTGAVLDIDHFKQINDADGHHVGDTVLKGLTQFLRQRLRKTDLIGRMGGEEFMIVFPETGQAAAWALLDDIRAQFGKFDYLGSRGRLHVSFSAGLAEWLPGQSLADWLHEIDRLLYAAKAAGRNRVLTAEDV